jgi:hypothetical protein
MLISGFSLIISVNVLKLLDIASENIENINAKKINASGLLNKILGLFFI